MALKSYLASLFLFITFISCELEAQPFVTRAAIDIGSGGTKLTVGDIDPLTNRILRIRDDILIGVKLRQDLAVSPDGLLSDHIQEELVHTIKQLQERMNKFAPLELNAVATSVFRTAKNGFAVLDKVESETGIKVKLLSQTEEGEIGFASAIAASNETKENLIVWDSGSGSFQLTTFRDGNIEMYGEEFGSTPALEKLYELRGQPIAIGLRIPAISLQEALSLCEAIRAELPCPPEWVSSGNKRVVAIGSTIFYRTATALGKLTYSKEEVLQGMIEACSRHDDELSPLIISMAFLYAVMDHCQISELTYCKTNGSTEGLLTIPKLWKCENFETMIF